MTLTVIHRPSPNFNARKRPLSMLVLHYTGMQTGEAAIERLCDAQAGVSAHYVVEEDGRVFQLVAESQRAWHAGVGSWAGAGDINSASIGIEIVNGGHDFGLPAYPQAQMQAVITLCRDILSRQSIAATQVIGHSDMAPDRKADPGEHFAWARLAEAGIGIWPPLDAEAVPSFDIEPALAEIGYATGAYKLADILTAFQRRFRPAQVDGALDDQTRQRIGQVLAAYRADG